MITASNIVSTVYRLLGNPSQSDLPYQDVLHYLARIVSGHLIDMKMLGRNHTSVIGSWVTPTGREMNASAFAGGETNFIPTRMEWLPLGDYDTAIPRTVEITGLEVLNERLRSSHGEAYVAFYNGMQSIAFSDPHEVVINRQYRLTYESTAMASLGMSDSVTLPEDFTILCEFETALFCLDQVANESEKWMEKRERLRATLGMETARWLERFQKWQNSRFGNKLVNKVGYRR